MDARTFTQDADRAELLAMSEEVVAMLRRVRGGFTHLDIQALQAAAQEGRALHRRERALMERIVRRSALALSMPTGREDEAVFLPMHMDRIVSNIEQLAVEAERAVRDGALFTDRASREIRGLFDTVLELLENLHDALSTGNRTLVRSILDEGRACEAAANEYALLHEQRLVEGVCQPEASSIYLAMLDHLRGIEWHARQAAERLVPKA